MRADTSMLRLSLSLLGVVSSVIMLVPSLEAGRASGTIEFAPPAIFEGNTTARLGAGSYFVGYGIDGGIHASMDLSSDQLELSLVDYTEDFLFIGNDQYCQPPCAKGSYQTTPLHAGQGSLRLVADQSWFTLIVQPLEDSLSRIPRGQAFGIERAAVLSSGEYAHLDSLEPFPKNMVSWPNKYLVSVNAARHHLKVDSFTLDHTGTFFVMVSGATLQLTNSSGTHELTTGSWKETAPDDPTNLSQPHVRYHHTALVGTLAGRIGFRYEGPYGHVIARDATIENVANLSVPLSNARINISGLDYQSSGSPFLDLTGRFNLTFSDAEALVQQSGETNRALVSLDGDVVSVRENRGTLRTFGSPPVVGTAGLGLLLVLYAVVSWIRRGTVWIFARFLEGRLLTLAPFSAKLDATRPSQLLEHPVRRGIMQMLEADLAMAQLSDVRRAVSKSFGISTLAAYKHLRRLWLGGHITMVRSGRTFFVGPNSGSMGPLEQRAAASLLHSPTGFTVADYVCRHPGASQGEIVSNVIATLANRDPTDEGGQLTDGAVLKWLRKFESVRVASAMDAGAFGKAPRKGEGRGFGTEVHLVVRTTDPADARRVRYAPTDVLYDVVQAYVARRPVLGAALGELTRIRLLRRPHAARVP